MSTLPTIPYSQLTLGQELAKTAHADVHLSTWQRAQVVIKEFRLSRMTAEGQAEFVKEAQITAKLNHPHVVRLFGICNEPSHYCLVIEYIAKGALQTLLASAEPLTWKTRLQIGCDMTSGLAYLHDQKIFHRDMKSGNVLIDDTYRAKLTDFGQAKVKDEALKNSSVRGTLAWSPPELFEDRPLYTEKSDIYSLGMTLWELASRQTPYAGLLEPAIMMKIYRGEHPSVPSDTPAPFSSLIEACWQKEASNRPPANEVLKALETLRATQLESSAVASSSKPPATPLAASPTPASLKVADLFASLKRLSQNPQAIADPSLKSFFVTKLKELLMRSGTEPLNEGDRGLYRSLEHLLDDKGQINSIFRELLVETNISLTKTLQPSKGTLLSEPKTLADLFTSLTQVAKSPQVSTDQELKTLVVAKLKEIMNKPETEKPKEEEAVWYLILEHLLDSKGNINPVFRNVLVELNPPPPSLSAPASPVTQKLPVVSSSSKPAASPSIPALAFGAAQWNTHFGDVGLEPPLPPNIHEILNAPCPFWSGKKVSDTHLLTLIPIHVNGKPFCLDSLRELIKKPKQGPATDYRYYSDYIKPEDKARPPAKAYWVLMTRDVLSNSRNKNYSEQKQQADSLGNGYELPGLLEASTSVLMEHVRSGKRLYGDAPSTYTRCQEIDKNGYRCLLGGFSASGVDVSNDRGGIRYEDRGVGVRRKF